MSGQGFYRACWVALTVFLLPVLVEMAEAASSKNVAFILAIVTVGWICIGAFLLTTFEKGER